MEDREILINLPTIDSAAPAFNEFLKPEVNGLRMEANFFGAPIAAEIKEIRLSLGAGQR